MPSSTCSAAAPRTTSPLCRHAASNRAETAAPVVEADGLTKRFGNFTAADRITFRIGRGEIFGLLGPNGAGKSTTFKMMCGLLRPTAGRPAWPASTFIEAAGAARARVGYMAQKFSLYGDLSVRQNLNFFAGVYGLARARRREQLERMTAAFRLGPYLDASAGSLPLGFKQRLALACAVMHDPAVLFLDEPTSGRRSAHPARVLVAHQRHGRARRHGDGDDPLPRRGRVLRPHRAWSTAATSSPRARPTS